MILEPCYLEAEQCPKKINPAGLCMPFVDNPCGKMEKIISFLHLRRKFSLWDPKRSSNTYITTSLVSQWKAADANIGYFSYWCAAVSWITGCNYLLCLNHMLCFFISFSASACKCVCSYGKSPWSLCLLWQSVCLLQDKYHHWLFCFTVLSENKAVVMVTMGQQDGVSTVHPAWGGHLLPDFRIKWCCLDFTKLFYHKNLIRQFCNIIVWVRKTRLNTTFAFPSILNWSLEKHCSVHTPLWVFHLHCPLPSTFLLPSWLIFSFTVTLKKDFLICICD